MAGVVAKDNGGGSDGTGHSFWGFFTTDRLAGWVSALKASLETVGANFTEQGTNQPQPTKKNNNKKK